MIHWCAQVAYEQRRLAETEGRLVAAEWHQDWYERIVADPTCVGSYFYFVSGEIIYPAREPRHAHG